MNTQINYLYKDVDNFKQVNYQVIHGTITPEQVRQIHDCLESVTDFIPERVGLPCVRMDMYNPESDTPYCELDQNLPFCETSHEPTVDMDVDTLVQNFQKAHDEGWENADLCDIVPGYAPYDNSSQYLMTSADNVLIFNKAMSVEVIKQVLNDDGMAAMKNMPDELITALAANVLMNSKIPATHIKSFTGTVRQASGIFQAKERDLLYIDTDYANRLVRTFPNMPTEYFSKQIGSFTGMSIIKSNEDQESEAKYS